MLTKIDARESLMENDIKELKSRQSLSLQPLNKSIPEGDQLVNLKVSDTSSILISKSLLNRAKQSKKVSIFANKCFSSFCKVQDIFAKNFSGRCGKFSKKEFSIGIRNQLVYSSKVVIPDTTEDRKDIINKVIISKLPNYNRLLRKLKSGVSIQVNWLAIAN